MSESEDIQILKAQSELDRLDINDYAFDSERRSYYRVFTPPTVREVRESLGRDAEVRAKIDEMLAGNDSARRLYAAILLNEFDKHAARRILEEIRNDSSLVKVQKGVGHGSFECPVKRLAESFLTEGHLFGSYYHKLEALMDWHPALWHEARINRDSFTPESLPTLEEALQAKEDAEKLAQLRQKIAVLDAAGAAAKRFYAAALLEAIGEEAQTKRIWESLLNDHTPVLRVFGDIGIGVPASEIAAALLEDRPIGIGIVAKPRPKEISDYIGNASDWLMKRVFKKPE